LLLLCGAFSSFACRRASLSVPANSPVKLRRQGQTPGLLPPPPPPTNILRQHVSPSVLWPGMRHPPFRRAFHYLPVIVVLFAKHSFSPLLTPSRSVSPLLCAFAIALSFRFRVVRDNGFLILHPPHSFTPRTKLSGFPLVGLSYDALFASGFCVRLLRFISPGAPSFCFVTPFFYIDSAFPQLLLFYALINNRPASAIPTFRPL